MRVLVTTSHRSVVGGVETYLQAILPMLRNCGLQIGLLCANPAAVSKNRIDDCYHDLPVWVEPDPISALAVAARWKPDVIYNQGLPDPAAEALLESRFPVVYYAHNYDGMCISGGKCHSFPRIQSCTRRLAPECLGLYFPRRCGGLSPWTALRLYASNRQRQRMLSKYHAVLAASRHMVNELVVNGAGPGRVFLNPLFPPNVSCDVEPPKARPLAGRLLFIGRITALKGWRHLLEAIPQAAAKIGRDLSLQVAGDGPDREAFEAEASRAIPSRFLGWIGTEQRVAEMRYADLLVVPSVWPEPFGLVGIEAGCVGLPAVAYAVGGIPDWLKPGISGELAPGMLPKPGDLADAIVRVLGYESHWQRLRVGAWETAKEFTLEAHIDCLVKVLEQAASSRS